MSLATQPLIQAITLGSYNLDLLIAGIVLVIVGLAGPRMVPEGGRLWYVATVIGAICIVVWFILFLFAICC